MKDEQNIHYEAQVAKAQDNLERAMASGDPERIRKASNELEHARGEPHDIHQYD